MNSETIHFKKLTNRSNLIIIGENIKIPIFFFVGILVAIIVNIISGGYFSDRCVDYCTKSATSVFGKNQPASDVFISLIIGSINYLVTVALICLSAITMISNTLLVANSLLIGFTLGRTSGCLITLIKYGETFEHSFQGITALVFCIFSALLSLLCCLDAAALSCRIGHKGFRGEFSLIFSSELFECIIKFLSYSGTIIIISIIKSFLLWIITLL